MGKRYLFLVIVEAILCGNILHAQGTNKTKLLPITIGDSVENAKDTMPTSKRGGFRSYVNRLLGHSDVDEIDSIQILKDSIAKLNESISTLQQQKNQKPQYNIQRSTIDSLKREVNRLNKIITNQIVSTFGERINASTANNFFCFSVMESPLYYNYDKQRVDQSLNTALAMGYDTRGHEFNWIYNIYYDLLRNYEVYNAELIENINAIIEQFSYGKPNREFERERFEDRLAASKYYQIRGKGEYGTYRHIYYLDFQIEQVRELFKSEANFKKAKLLEIKEAL